MLVFDAVFGSFLGGKGSCALAVHTVLNTFVYCWKPVIDGGFSGFRNQPGEELRGLFMCSHLGYGETASWE